MRAKLKPITTKRYSLSPATIAKAIEMALDVTAQESLADLQKTTRTWATPVKFTINKLKYGRSIGTSNVIYKYVDQGTSPHVIRPKRPGYPLRFKTGGRAKTKVATIASYKGAPGNTPIAAYQVMHPGTQARLFTQVINTRNKRRFPKNLNAALREARQKANK